MSDASSTPPQFGLIDVIEAFTAMRHEYRNQTKESRDVAEGLHTTSEKIEDIAERFSERMDAAIETLRHQSLPRPTAPTDGSKKAIAFAATLAEIDHTVSRSVDAATRSLAQAGSSSRAPAGSAVDVAEERFSATDRLSALGPIARFFCRRFAKQLDNDYAREFDRREQQRNEQRDSSLAAIVSGLSMTADHLQRRVAQHGIERIEVTGQPFDGNLMRAVEVIDSHDVAPGHVAEQLSPAYRYDGRVLQYADVRLARPQ